MEARRGLRQECDASLRIVIALDAEVFDIGAGKGGDFPPEILWGQVQIFGADEISYAAAFVRFLNAGPDAVEFLLDLFRLVD
jgi:hypothetical protein